MLYYIAIYLLILKRGGREITEEKVSNQNLLCAYVKLSQTNSKP